MEKPKELSDFDLIEDIKNNNSSSSLIALTERHKGLVKNMIKKYSSSFAQCSGVAYEDLIEDKEFIVFDAVRSYEQNKNTKFSTWLGNKTRFHCLNTQRKQSKYYNPNDPEITDLILENASQDLDDKNVVELESEYVLALIDQMKDKRIKDLIHIRYFSENKKERSFENIARVLDMSKQGVINLHNEFLYFIRNKINSKNLSDEI